MLFSFHSTLLYILPYRLCGDLHFFVLYLNERSQMKISLITLKLLPDLM